MSAVRLRRLNADHERLSELARRHPRIRIMQVSGTPPDRYQIRFDVRSVRLRDGRVEPADQHLVEIALPLGYPRQPPHCRMLTPIFHPNIAPHAICIGDHWSPGETLASIVVRIAEMLGYQSYNNKSPLNGEAARWTDGNLHRLPLDPATMMLEEPDDAGASSGTSPTTPRESRSSADGVDVPPPSSTTAPPAPARSVAAVELECSICGARLRVANASSLRVRCPRCRSVSDVPARGRP